jgi:hypothetical protein
MKIIRDFKQQETLTEDIIKYLGEMKPIYANTHPLICSVNKNGSMIISEIKSIWSTDVNNIFIANYYYGNDSRKKLEPITEVKFIETLINRYESLKLKEEIDFCLNEETPEYPEGEVNIDIQLSFKEYDFDDCIMDTKVDCITRLPNGRLLLSDSKSLKILNSYIEINN